MDEGKREKYSDMISYCLSDSFSVKMLTNLREHHKDTFIHSLNVSFYAFIIGSDLDYYPLEDIVLSAILHDIGKVVVPADILDSPRKLHELDERAVKKLKSHPLRGYITLKSYGKYNEDVLQGVKNHHLKPGRDISGNDLSLLDKIVSLSDIYSALVVPRPYHTVRRGRADALKLMRESESGVDKNLLDIFENNLSKLKVM